MSTTSRTPGRSRIIRYCLIILTAIAIGALLVAARDFFYPLCLGILLAFLIYPLVKFMERYIPWRIGATLLSVVLSIVVVAGFLFFLYEQFSIFLEELPRLQENAKNNLQSLQQYLDKNTPLNFDPNHTLADGIIKSMGAENGLLQDVFNATTGTIIGLGLQPVYVYFLLYYRHHFRNFIYLLIKEENHDKLDVILSEISDVTKNYVSGVFIVVLILCVLNSIGLLIIGLKYAVMLGILSALMNFIPYFGTLIGAAFPIMYTLASEQPDKVWGVIILFLIIQFTENNVLTPTITGGRVAINPLFTIFIIIIGSLVWGIPGMFLFVPFAGMFKVICDHVEPLKPVAYLISPQNPQKSKVFDQVKSWFGR